jgi:hypothetical protein
MALETEIGAFRRELPNMLSEHDGQFALVHGDLVDSFYITEDEAYEAGCQRFGLDPFLVRRVEASEPVSYSFLDIHPRCPS